MARKYKNEEMYNIYLKAYLKNIEDAMKVIENNPRSNIKQFLVKTIVYGVKMVNSKPEPEYIDRKETEADFQFASMIKDLMGSLTPIEFMNLYPIAKEYSGHKYGMKDYFYTRDYIKSFHPDRPIGEKILEFIWEYHNWELTDFNVEIMQYMSRLRRLEGQPSLMEEFADTMGLKTYTMHTDSKGKQYLFDKEKNKTIPLKKSKPIYLKLVK